MAFNVFDFDPALMKSRNYVINKKVFETETKTLSGIFQIKVSPDYENMDLSLEILLDDVQVLYKEKWFYPDNPAEPPIMNEIGIQIQNKYRVQIISVMNSFLSVMKNIKN